MNWMTKPTITQTTKTNRGQFKNHQNTGDFRILAKYLWIRWSMNQRVMRSSHSMITPHQPTIIVSVDFSWAFIFFPKNIHIHKYLDMKSGEKCIDVYVSMLAFCLCNGTVNFHFCVWCLRWWGPLKTLFTRTWILTCAMTFSMYLCVQVLKFLAPRNQWESDSRDPWICAPHASCKIKFNHLQR